jgi:ABC-type lipoprotein export system ATPase subunit
VARSLVNSPRLLLCDEPTGDLDSRTGEEVARLILSMRDERGVVVVVVTHNERLAQVFGRRLLLEGGRLIE